MKEDLTGHIFGNFTVISKIQHNYQKERKENFK